MGTQLHTSQESAKSVSARPTSPGPSGNGKLLLVFWLSSPLQVRSKTNPQGSGVKDGSALLCISHSLAKAAAMCYCITHSPAEFSRLRLWEEDSKSTWTAKTEAPHLVAGGKCCSSINVDLHHCAGLEPVPHVRWKMKFSAS